MNKIVAHRGFSSRKLENTMDAFKLAFGEKYIDMVELDIRMTSDKKIVCIHDNFIMNNYRKEYIKKMTYEELRKPILHDTDFFIELLKYITKFSSLWNAFYLLRYKRKKGTIPLLEDVLEILPLSKEVIVEIKGSNSDYDDDTYEEEILKVLDKYSNKKISVMSFDKNIIMSIKKKRPKLKLGILIDKNLNDINLPVDFVSMSYKVINYENIEKLLKSKKTIVLWTINTYGEYLYLKKQCADLFGKIAITTDFPDLINYLLKRDMATK